MSGFDPGLQQTPGEPAVAVHKAGGGRGWHSLGLRTAVAAVVACGLAAGSYGIASGASSHGAVAGFASLATAPSPGSSTPSTTLPARRPPRLGGPGGFGHFGTGGGGPSAFGRGGTITSFSATTITVETEFGASVTVTTNSSTTYSEGGKKLDRTALATGEEVIFLPAARPTTSSPSSSTVVRAVVIVLPHVSGKVFSVVGSVVTVTQQDGLNVTVNTSSATTYEEEGQSVPSSDLQAGAVVSVTGTLSSDHTEIDATTIQIVLPSVSGRVTDVSGTTITITGFNGTSESVTTDSSTVFRDQSGTTTIASVAKGDFVQAFGTPGSDNSFAAVTVYVGPSTSAAPALPGGGGGPGPFGFGRPGMPGGSAAPGSFRGFGGAAGWGAHSGAGTTAGGGPASASSSL
ncbi:MAG: DUF5666 domain-containing protein [Acidimicrobiales bacterium]